MADKYLLIGEITKPQGIHGEIKVRPVTCDPTRFYDLKQIFLKRGDEYAPRGVQTRSVGPEAVFMRMEGVETRNDAEAMRGMELYIDREHAVVLGEDENFIVDLIGCTAVDTEGKIYGKVIDVLQPGGNDVYVVNSPEGDILIPALKAVVRKVDVEKKEMLLDAKRLMETAVFPDSEEMR